MKKRYIGISLLTLLAITTGVIAFNVIKNHNNYQYLEASELPFVPENELPTSYPINSEFKVPKGKISYDGQLYSYNDYYLKYPNGKMYKKSNFTLDVVGQYECGFIYKDSSLQLTAHYYFQVFNNAYQLSSNQSYAYYTEKIPTKYEDAPGITVSLAESDIFTYNQVVDIKDASLDKPLIVYHPYAYTLRANPDNAGKNMAPNTVYEYNDPNKPRPGILDANCSVVRVTDAYDPSIYFETFIYFRTANMGNNRQQQYAVVGASNQSKVGIERASEKGTGNRVVSIDGVSYREYIGLTPSSFGITLNTTSSRIRETRYKEEIDEETGEVVKTPFLANIGTTLDYKTTADVSNGDDYGFSIYYDYKTMKVYIKHVNTFFVNDLDEPVLHGTNLFPGFKTGEVYISVYNLEYKEKNATFDIESIYGINDLSVTKVIDNTPPIIKLDNDNRNFNIAVNEPFNLFNAEVIDYNYDGDLVTSVYYEYGSNQEHQVNVINNTFTPTKPGQYTIVYEARDRFNNIGVEKVNLHAIATASNRSIDFSVEQLDEVEAGQKIILPTPSITVYNNSPIISCFAKYEDGSVTEINTNTWEFFVKKPGQYELNYEYSDGISTYTYKYTFEATTSNKFYLEDISLPRYFIKNAHYTLDEAKVVKVATKDLTYDNPDIYINEDNNGFNRQINYKDVITSANESIQLQYRYNNEVIYTSDIIPVKDVDFTGVLDKSAYFDCHNIISETRTSSISLSVTNSNHPTATFINPLSFSNFSLTIDLNSTVLNNSKLNMILSDFENPDNTFVISFTNNADGKTVKVSYSDIVDFNITNSTFTISYDFLRNYLSDSFDNGFAFDNPFPSDRFYLSFVLVNSEGNEKISLQNINGQVLNNDIGDVTTPIIPVPHIEGSHPLGSIIDLSFIYPDDTLSPYYEKNYYFTITYYTDDSFTNGQEVKSIDGITLDGYQDINKDYSFALDKPGVYEIYYSYKDQSENKSSNSGLRIIYCSDYEAPTITLNNGYDTSTVITANVGSNYTVMGYKVSDNYDSKVEVSIYVLTPSLVYKKLNGKSFKLNEKGDYRIYYVAKDSTGNIADTYYTVRAK